MNIDKSFLLQNPNCIQQKIIIAVRLDDILLEKNLSSTSVLVCHKNAQFLSGNTVILKSNCDHCNLCRIFNGLEKFIFCAPLEKCLFENLNSINMLLRHLFPNLVVATEVKTPGNSRDKRIDLVIKKHKEIFLIKLLNNLDKYNLYNMSYRDIISNNDHVYTKYSFRSIILVPGNKKCVAQKRGLDVMTFEELVQLLKGD